MFWLKLKWDDLHPSAGLFASGFTDQLEMYRGNTIQTKKTHAMTRDPEKGPGRIGKDTTLKCALVIWLWSLLRINGQCLSINCILPPVNVHVWWIQWRSLCEKKCPMCAQLKVFLCECIKLHFKPTHLRRVTVGAKRRSDSCFLRHDGFNMI